MSTPEQRNYEHRAQAAGRSAAAISGATFGVQKAMDVLGDTFTGDAFTDELAAEARAELEQALAHLHAAARRAAKLRDLTRGTAEGAAVVGVLA